jgi:magnesium chelatase subunit I
MDLAENLGQLKASGWTSVPVKDEIRRNAIARIQSNEPLFDGVLGYENTVAPQLENALLAGHDVVFLGERGQAKTRMIRSCIGLLDEWMPIIAGSEINDDPLNPVSKYAKDLVEAEGDDTKISWVHRSNRFAEKLATPDTSIADLIGEVDPIKVAEGRYLSDELTLHYGMVPRSNRGLFAINELPDLAERIQVGLLNVLEERDVQIRGYRIQLPLDVMLFASANPEDYTNRGRIITPLKDRFGTQIRTHYPLEIDTEIDIVEQEAEVFSADGIDVSVPDFMAEIVATMSHLARENPHVNQRSGVSVRLSIANYETLVASAVRRTLRHGATKAVPRIADLPALVPSTMGKIEVESMDDGRDMEIIEHLTAAATVVAFKEALEHNEVSDILEAFEANEAVVHTGDDIADADYLDMVNNMPALGSALKALGYAPDDMTDPALVASGVEFILEGLHLSKRLNKEALGSSAVYRSR